MQLYFQVLSDETTKIPIILNWQMLYCVRLNVKIIGVQNNSKEMNLKKSNLSLKKSEDSYFYHFRENISGFFHKF